MRFPFLRTRAEHRLSRFPKRSGCLLALEELEDRRLLSNLFDAPWRAFDTGAFPGSTFGPNAIAVGDLNSDGKPDVVVGNGFFGQPGISILLNQGDGTYTPPVAYPLPINQTVGDVALADIDGDGKLDVLATIPDGFGQSHKLALWRNHGDGTLAPRREFDTGPGPIGLVVGDFTGRGLPDVVTANYGSGTNDTITLLRHNALTGAAAGFLPPVAFHVGAGIQRLAAADLNGDGHLDLVAGRTDAFGMQFGTLSVLHNDGAGGFGAPTDYQAVPGARLFTAAVALADVDRDGFPDLVGGGLVSEGSLDHGIVTVRHNNGDGTFGSVQVYDLDTIVEAPHQLTQADLNGDGFPDLIATSANGRATDGWSVLLNNGTGGFQPAVRYYAAKQTFATAAVDVDGDGKTDVITVANDSAVITVHHNPGNGVFPVPPQYPAGTVVAGFDAGDLNGDGSLDIVTADNDLLGRVRVLRNDGHGVFSQTGIYSEPIHPRDVKLRDLNGDGRLDLLMGPNGNFAPYHFATALNRGDGTFADGVITPVYASGEGSIDAFDLENNGRLDVVLVEEETNPRSLNARIFLFRNDGSAHFTLVNILLPPGLPFGGVAAADLNHDGNLDLILSVAGRIIVYLGNGDLTFRPPIITNISAFTFTLADLNGDGNLDVATIVPQSSFGTVSIALALGKGDGSFGTARLYPGASGLESAFRISWEIHAADVDRDGKVDVVVSNDASNDISVFLGNGDGTLQPHQRYGIGYSPRFFSVADFTGDGTPDIAAVIALPFNGLNSAVALLPGLTTGTHPPVLDPIPDQTIPSSQTVLEVTLHATDANGDPLTFTVTAQSLAYVLGQRTGTVTYASGSDNYAGRDEKWLQAGDGQWYFILPTGDYYRWDGGAGADGTLLGNVGASYWTDPTRLTNPPADPLYVAFSISGTTLTITRDLTWVDTLVLTVTVSDGQLTDNKTFIVAITV